MNPEPPIYTYEYRVDFGDLPIWGAVAGLLIGLVVLFFTQLKAKP